jgi:hypothetical protein
MPDRSVSVTKLLSDPTAGAFRFIVLGDTGEGDHSQYSMLPLIRGLNPDFMIINGDIAYPAGNMEDYHSGFFEPYRGLNIPIWGVPGNHEYYSRYQGEEFHEVFCTRKLREVWSKFGLRLVVQPGTYWELDGGDKFPVVVLGVDTGKTGNLDGKGRGRTEDFKQHQWLRSRLQRVEDHNQEAKGHDRKQGVMILFHIPGLVNQTHEKDTQLKTLHRIISEYSCVKLVVTAHEHNFQRYDPATFKDYLRVAHQVNPARGFDSWYMVSGGGGAFLGDSTFRKQDFNSDGEPFPNPAEWRDVASLPQRITVRVAKWAIGRVTAFAAPTKDPDTGKYLSLLLVEADNQGVRVYPVWMKDVRDLFSAGVQSVQVMDKTPPVDPTKLDTMIQRNKAVHLA